jgi:transposase
MTREYGRAPRGVRVVQRLPRNRGTVTTMLGALGLGGVQALMTKQGGTNRATFIEFLTEHLIPTLEPGDVVVMDNLGAHHAGGVRELIQAAGAQVLYLPPYSPDFNPIELCWSKLKGILKALGARTVASLRKLIEVAADLITAEDSRGWFAHCGYGRPQRE